MKVMKLNVIKPQNAPQLTSEPRMCSQYRMLRALIFKIQGQRSGSQDDVTDSYRFVQCVILMLCIYSITFSRRSIRSDISTFVLAGRRRLLLHRRSHPTYCLTTVQTNATCRVRLFYSLVSQLLIWLFF